MSKKTVFRLGVAIVGISACILFSACSQSTKPSTEETAEKPAEPAGPPQPVTAKAAFGEMYMSARDWSKDLVILKLTQKEISGIKNEGGKAGMWEATFASPTRQEYRVYSYAVASGGEAAQKGVSMSPALAWGGPTRDVMPVQVSDMGVDSDAIYNTAAGDAAAWLKKHPDKQITSFELGNAYKFQEPVWVVTWGDEKSGYRVFVSADTGKVFNKKKG